MAPPLDPKTEGPQFGIEQLAICFLDGFGPSFDRFSLTIAQARKFCGEDPIHAKFDGPQRIVHVAQGTGRFSLPIRRKERLEGTACPEFPLGENELPSWHRTRFDTVTTIGIPEASGLIESTPSVFVMQCLQRERSSLAIPGGPIRQAIPQAASDQAVR